MLISEHFTREGYPQLQPSEDHLLKLNVMDENGEVCEVIEQRETAEERTDITKLAERLPKLNEAAKSHLLKNLKSEINSGLYVIDKRAANRLVAKFANDFHAGTNFEQGYILGKIGEAQIDVRNIPDKVHINPVNYSERQGKTGEELNRVLSKPYENHHDSSFFHFNVDFLPKAELIELFFLTNKDIFFTPVFHVGTKSE